MLIDEETERGSPGAVMRDTFRSAQCSHSARRGSTVLFEKRGPSARREFYVPYNHIRQVTREKVKIAFKGK